MPVRIILSEDAPPAQQISDQIRGFITTGRLLPDDRLPSVRQLAHDLGVSPGTVAKVYRALEADELVITRIGAGTRVHPDAGGDTPRSVLEAARRLAETSAEEGMKLGEVSRVLGAVWPIQAPRTK